MPDIESSITLYRCPRCDLTKMDSCQMVVHSRDCGDEFEPVEYVPVAEVGEMTNRIRAEADRWECLRCEALEAEVERLREVHRETQEAWNKKDDMFQRWVGENAHERDEALAEVERQHNQAQVGYERARVAEAEVERLREALKLIETNGTGMYARGVAKDALNA